MLQVTGTWDLRTIQPHPSPLMQMYMWFLLVTCVLAVAKLIRGWIAAPPFRPRSVEKGELAARLLERMALSLSRWSKLTLLVCAVFLTTRLADISQRLMDEKVIGWFTILILTRDFAQALAFALWVVLFIYAVRWHVLHRISRLRL